MIMVAFGSILSLIRSVFAHVPWGHWAVIGTVSLALTVVLLIRKRYSTYSAICFGLSVFLGLFLLDTAVGIRWGDGVKHMTGFSLSAEYHRIVLGGVARWTEMFANVAVFVPFGFFLSEFLSTTKRFSARRQIDRVALVAFGLSLCIETLQLVFRLGVFEITDLVLNTLGGFVGSLISVGLRKVVGREVIDINP